MVDQASRPGERVRSGQIWDEVAAAIAALEALTRPSQVELTTDSTYLRDGITRWIHGWKRRGSKKADGHPVLNRDLWQELEVELGPWWATAPLPAKEFARACFPEEEVDLSAVVSAARSVGMFSPRRVVFVIGRSRSMMRPRSSP